MSGRFNIEATVEDHVRKARLEERDRHNAQIRDATRILAAHTWNRYEDRVPLLMKYGPFSLIEAHEVIDDLDYISVGC